MVKSAEDKRMAQCAEVARLCQLWPRLRLRLLQPEAHVHLAVQRRRGGEVLARLLTLARTVGEPAGAEVAMGDEGPHPEFLGQCERLAVVGLAALGVEPVGMGRNLG
jgi:hypothetical protein